MAHETLPAHLRQRTLDAVRKAAAEERKAMPPVVPGSLERRIANEAPRRDWLGWAVAAAALAVAAFSFSRQPNLGVESPIELRSELLAAAKQMIPLGRPGTPEEAAGSVVMLTYPESDYISGQLIITGGGYEG